MIDWMTQRKSLRLTGACATIGCVFGALVIASGAHAAQHRPVGALYVQTNDHSHNEILVYDRASDGRLTYRTRVATGGVGGVVVGGSGAPLASQGSLITANDGQVLLAANAGSNSISVFAIRGNQLRRTQILGSGGTFPVSIAAHGDLVAVLNAGGTGTVAEFRMHHASLQPLADGTRSLGLANTTPPSGRTSPSEIGFGPDGRMLVVTAKSSLQSGIVVFPVGRNGHLAAAPVVTTSTTPIPYAFTFSPQGTLIVGEAADSAISTYRISSTGALIAIGSVTDGQHSLCWTASTNRFTFASNAGSGNISAIRIDATQTPQLLGVVATVGAAGPTDLVTTANGRFLYAEDGGLGTISAFSIQSNGSLTPRGGITGLPVPPNAIEGIATSDTAMAHARER